MSEIKKLHISKLTLKNYKKNDVLIGPWCDYLDFFLNSDNYLIDTSFENTNLKKYNIECNEIINNVINVLAVNLNKYHNTTYSKTFWEIMLVNWVTCIVNNLHYYYYQLKNIDMKTEDKLVAIIDDKFIFNKISEPMSLMGSQEYIHSLISFLIKNGNFINILYEEIPVINEKMPSLEKYKPNFLKKIIWNALKKTKSKKLLYGIAGVKIKDILKNYHKFYTYSISSKIQKNSYSKDFNIRNNFSLGENSSNKLQNLVLLFIEKNLPASLLESFDLLIKQAVDYKNKKLIIATPGLYIDEQLIELALAKELNNAKIVQIQEAGNAMGNDSASANFLYQPIDYYFTWGWKEHAGYKGMFFNVPSRLSTIKDIHYERFDNILYLTKFPVMYASLYDSVIIKNWKKYFRNRVEFIQHINNTKYKSKLTLKLHHGSMKCFDEIKLMENMNCDVSLYDNNELNMKNTAILYVDYLSSIFYESLVSNVPVIMCIDPDVDKPNQNLQYFINKFKNVGVIFDNSKDAAKKIEEIYDKRAEFWNTKEVQDVRKEFLVDYVHTSSDWIGDTMKTIEKMSNIK